LIPYVLIWLLFTLTYLMMPNTRVKISAAVVAGIVAGTIYQLLQLVYINFQFLLANYNAIYGSFAALPLFLIWLQASWLIVLMGAQIACAYQNKESYEFEKVTRQISPALKKQLALQVTHLLVTRFARAEKPYTARQISTALEIPIRLVQTTINDLLATQIASETDSGIPEEPAYQPALDINLLTIGYITDALDKIGVNQLDLPENQTAGTILHAMQQFQNAINQHPENQLLKDI
jgi:membrane protein